MSRRGPELSPPADSLNTASLPSAWARTCCKRIENWGSVGLLDWPGYGEEVGLTGEAWRTLICHLASPRPAAQEELVAPTCCPSTVRPIVLVSLFDGLGTAHLALQEAGQPAAVVYTGVAELDPSLAMVVEAHRHTGVALIAWTPCQRLYANVWDLLRQDGGRFPRLCEQLPRGALTLLIGGSPCQDLTSIGPGGGQVGLCGERSVHFYIFPVLAWALSRARPDLLRTRVGRECGLDASRALAGHGSSAWH